MNPADPENRVERFFRSHAGFFFVNQERCGQYGRVIFAEEMDEVMQYGSPGAQRSMQQLCFLPVDRISPRQTCSMSQEEACDLSALAESIRTGGLMRPITVQKTGEGRYTVVSGNRRLMACRMLGMTHVDAVVLWSGPTEMNASGLMQSLMSGRLHYLEQARALQALNLVHGLSREDIARSLGASVAQITSLIHLTALDEELQVFLMEENVPERIAQALLRVPDREARMRIARQAVRQRLSVRDVEAMVSSALTRLPLKETGGGRTIRRMRDHRLYLNAIREIIAQMQEAGVETSVTERKAADRIELTLTLSTRRRRCHS